VPGWCNAPEVWLNGQAAEVAAEPGSYIVIDRAWQDGDQVRLRLPMQLSVKAWEAQKGARSVHYGPLAFSLKIGEKWEPYWEEGDWKAYEVFADTPWNYGLVLDPTSPQASFELTATAGALPDQPFTPDNAPIQLRAKGKRIPAWKMVGGIAGPLQDSPAQSDEPVEDITLVPMGCARLRISVFPVIGEGPDAKEWETSNIEPSASHVHDALNALCDGIEPGTSGDHSIPRFTWWDHRGGAEWVQYTFAKARTITGCEVYWFDDRGIKGNCRVPQSWKLTYRDGDEWKEVGNPSAYGVTMDQFNRCTFDPITTEVLRLEVELQPAWSGGILEWKLIDG